MVRKTRKKTFYEIVNKRWLSDTELPNTESRVTQSYFIREQIEKELDSIIYKTKTGPIAELRKSWNLAAKEVIPDGISPIIQIMQSMNGYRDISERIGWMRRNGMNAPLDIYIQSDPRNHAKCRVFIEEGTPSIGISEYWLERKHAPIRSAYYNYCKNLAKAVGVPNTVMGYESEGEMAHQYPKGVERWDIYNRINMMTWRELTREYTTINWTAMFIAYGLKEETLPHLLYNITSHAFLHRLQTRIRSWSMDRWRGWFTLTVTQWLAGISPHGPLRSAWFAYKQRFIQGKIHDEIPAKLEMAIIYSLLPQTLGHLWVKEFCQESLQKNVLKMITTIKKAAAIIFRKTSWMSQETKKQAVKKLQFMDIQVAWPPKWDDTEKGCTLNDTNFIDNLLTLAGNRTDMYITKMQKGCNVRNLMWSRPAYEVNAFYYPEENKFVMPAAILRPPYYDLTRSLAWNYGGIGATIGHEISHGFDSDGRSYDHRGELRDWWGPHDAHEYKVRAEKLAKLFDSATYRGMSVQGYLTLVENIADLVGLQFALEGLKLAMGRPLTNLEIKEFFTAYTVSWRSKDRLKKAEHLLETNVHAPPMLRVNLVIAQFQEWYEAFEITDTHPNFIPVEKRIQFFGEDLLQK